MDDDRLERIRSRVGESIQTVRGLEVEQGKVVEFADAIGDENPIYRNPSVVNKRGLDQIPAPISFTWLHMFPHHRPSGVNHLGFDLGLDERALMHGEQSYAFERPVFVGDRLSGTTTLTGAERRSGSRGGTMTIVRFETELVDETGDLVVTESTTTIETEGAVNDGDDQPATTTESTSMRDGDTVQASSSDTDQRLSDRHSMRRPSFATIRREGMSLDQRLYRSDLEIGATATLTVEGVGRTDFVRYAGASGDFNPVHYDPTYANTLGYPDVFGQGMLTAGYVGSLLSAWFGVDAVTAIDNRFTATTWPGDTLTVTGEIVSVDCPEATIEFQVVRQTNETVVRGSASISLADR